MHDYIKERTMKIGLLHCGNAKYGSHRLQRIWCFQKHCAQGSDRTTARDQSGTGQRSKGDFGISQIDATFEGGRSNQDQV